MYKNLYPIHGSHSPFHRKMCIPLLVRCHCPPTKSNLYLDSSLENVIVQPTLYILRTFQVPNLIFIFHPMGHLAKESIPARGSVNMFVTVFFYGEELLAQSLSWWTTRCRLLAAAYSIYSELSYIPVGTMLWWHGAHLTRSGST
jgi:hypothetical protein